MRKLPCKAIFTERNEDHDKIRKRKISGSPFCRCDITGFGNGIRLGYHRSGSNEHVGICFGILVSHSDERAYRFPVSLRYGRRLESGKSAGSIKRRYSVRNNLGQSHNIRGPYQRSKASRQSVSPYHIWIRSALHPIIPSTAHGLTEFRKLLIMW